MLRFPNGRILFRKAFRAKIATGLRDLLIEVRTVFEPAPTVRAARGNLMLMTHW
jgi:hypothetical protein